MSLNTTQRYLTILIDTLSGLLRYFPRFSIYVEDIRSMLRSITKPNAPLPRQEAAVKVDFRTRPIPGLEQLNSDESTLPLVNEKDKTPTSPSGMGMDKSVPGNALTSPNPLQDRSIDLPLNYEDFFWPYLGTLGYDTDLISDPSHGLL